MNYFAYGSNLDRVQMQKRCPGATLIGLGELENYRFIINSRGVASVVSEPGAMVQGLVWNLSMSDVQKLDRFEGVQYRTYLKTTDCNIRMDTGYVETLIYIASCNIIGFPRLGYLENIVAMAIYLKFNRDYVEELKTWMSAENL